MSAAPVGHVRQHLERATRDIHHVLHHDPILRPLSMPGLTTAEYSAALSVFAVFYHAIEKARLRLGAFDCFSLRPECDALMADLQQDFLIPSGLAVENNSELLGALYVAHGAAFGRNTFRKNVLHALPYQSHRFVRLVADVDNWNGLIATLDQAGASQPELAHIQNGATHAFLFIQQLAYGQRTKCVQVEPI